MTLFVQQHVSSGWRCFGDFQRMHKWCVTICLWLVFFSMGIGTGTGCNKRILFLHWRSNVLHSSWALHVCHISASFDNIIIIITYLSSCAAFVVHSSSVFHSSLSLLSSLKISLRRHCRVCCYCQDMQNWTAKTLCTGRNFKNKGNALENVILGRHSRITLF